MREREEREKMNDMRMVKKYFIIKKELKI